MTPGAHTVARRARSMMVALVVVSVALFTLAGAILYRTVSDREWAPLGPYPDQRVDLPRDSTDTPVVSLTDPVVPVTGRKCVEGDGFTIVGALSYQSVRPRGTIIQTGQGRRPATDGCVDFQFLNTIPGQVQRAMRHQLAAGERPLWRITGVETPISDDRGEGVRATWATEPFLVVP